MKSKLGLSGRNLGGPRDRIHLMGPLLCSKSSKKNSFLNSGMVSLRQLYDCLMSVEE